MPNQIRLSLPAGRPRLQLDQIGGDPRGLADRGAQPESRVRCEGDAAVHRPRVRAGVAARVTEVPAVDAEADRVHGAGGLAVGVDGDRVRGRGPRERQTALAAVADPCLEQLVAADRSGDREAVPGVVLGWGVGRRRRAQGGDEGGGDGREYGDHAERAEGTALLGAADLLLHTGQQVARVLVGGGGTGGELVAQVLEVHHGVSRSAGVAREGSRRSLARALAVWLLTVPTELPISRAVSASLRSS